MLCLLDPLVCLQVVGLYRLCGSAAVKKELREAFERDSYAVELCENTYPDVNVITGKLIAGNGELKMANVAHRVTDTHATISQSASVFCRQLLLSNEQSKT